MAEALAAIGGAASILSILDVLARSIGTIGDLRQEWKTADLTVLDLLAQLKAIRAALTEIHRWTTSDAGLEPHHQLQMDLDDSVTWCSILAEMIDKLLSGLGYNPDEVLDRSSKAKLLFASKEMENLQKMIDRQANALNLLLSACRLPTALEQKGLLERSSSRKVLKKLADDSASLIVHRDSSSLFTYYTDNQSKLSRTFDFDLEVFNSKAYERAIRGALKTVVRQRRGELEAVQARRNAEIERSLRRDKRRQEMEVKMLLLGTDSSVISGFLKQMQLIHAGRFSQLERQQWRSVLFNNLVMAFQNVFGAMTDLQIDFEIDDSERLAASITSDLEISPDESLPLEALRAFHALWQDRGVQLALLRGNGYALHDNLEYFMQDIDRLLLPDYLPSDQDILRTRLRSPGLQEVSFDLENLTYRMFHISGQRSERKKWIHVLDNVYTVLFFAPLDSYDQALVEDGDGNQMHEALMLFESTANSVHFEKSGIILFLSDVHRFRAKIESGLSPVQRYFPEYHGKSNDVAAIQKFFADKFKNLVLNPSKEVYVHFISMQDTDILKRVIASAQDMLVKQREDQLVL